MLQPVKGGVSPPFLFLPNFVWFLSPFYQVNTPVSDSLHFLEGGGSPTQWFSLYVRDTPRYFWCRLEGFTFSKLKPFGMTIPKNPLSPPELAFKTHASSPGMGTSELTPISKLSHVPHRILVYFPSSNKNGVLIEACWYGTSWFEDGPPPLKNRLSVEWPEGPSGRRASKHPTSDHHCSPSEIKVVPQ